MTRADLPVNQEQTNGNVNHNLTSESPAIYMYENKSHEIENNDEIPDANSLNEIENIETNAYQVTETISDGDFFAIQEYFNLDDQIPEADASNQYPPNIFNHPLNSFW